jgi:hypothetical protein
VAALVGARSTLIGAGVIGGAITLGALFLPGMRAIEDVEGASGSRGRGAELGSKQSVPSTN